MKIAIFENEYEAVRGAFETANYMEFNNSLDISVYASSQLADFESLKKCKVIFVDIGLSQKSELDGFGVISRIKEMDDDLANRIVILTGNNKIKEAMQDRKITDSRIKIIIKPTDYEEVSSLMKKME